VVVLGSLKKHLLWIVPVIIALILFGLQYIYQIQSERQLPNKGWSRTIHLPIKTKEGKEYIYTDSDGYNIYTYTNKTIYYTKLTKTLKLLVKKKQVFDDNIAHIYWGKGNQYIFKKGLDVFYFNGKSTILLAKKAGPTATDGKMVYYAKGTQLFQMGVQTKATSVIGNYNFPIQTLYLGSDHNLLITTQDMVKNRGYFHFVDLGKDAHPSYRFATYLLGENTHISPSTAYAPHDGKVGLYFVVSVARGGLSYSQYYLDLPYEKLETDNAVDLNPKPIMVFQTGTGMNISDMTDVNFSYKDGKPTLLFAANGFRTKRDTNAMNIYEAHPNAKGKWVADRRSITTDTTISPFWLGKNAIGWYSYTKKGIYEIEATSKNPSTIKESLKLRGEDLSMAISNSFLSLSRVLILILLSLVFSVGGLFVFVIISFVMVDWIEKEVPIVKWLIIAIFLLGQIWLAHRVMSSAFAYYAPGYLVFQGNFIVFPLLIGAISLYLTHIIKPKDWGMLSAISTFAMLYIVTISFLVGPYYF
jgi:hypothetical protein